MSAHALELDGISRDERIRQLIAEHGGTFANYRAIAEVVLAEGLFDDDELEAMQIAGIIARVKKAVRTGEVDGLPFAGVVNEGGQVRQFEFWSYEDYCYNFTMKAESARRDIVALRAIHAACLGKFGKAPDLPQFDQ